MTLMRGAHPVRTDLMNFFAAKVPLMVTKANQQWGTTIAAPQRYEAYEPTGLTHNEGPLVGIGVSRAGQFTTTDLDPWGAMQYRVEYSVSVYMWCFTEVPEDGTVPPDARVQTLGLRDDLAAIIRATILDNPSLGNPEVYQTIESTLTESYSEGSPTPNASGRWVAGVVHTFTVKVDESLDRTGTQTADVIAIDQTTLE